MLTARSKSSRIIQGLAFVTAVITLFAIIGYAYGVKDLYGFLMYTPMAFNTALAFLSMSAGILLTDPTEGFMREVSSRHFGGILARRIMPIVVVVPGVYGLVILLSIQSALFSVPYALAIFVLLIIVTFIFSTYFFAASTNNIDRRRSAAEKENAESFAQMESHNKELEDTKRAMLNLLEDLNQEKEKIEQERARDEAILSSIGDAVFAVDSAGTIILFNGIAETLSGFSAREAIGTNYQKILNFILEGTRESNLEFIEAALEGQKTQMAKHTVLISKSGAEIPVADSAASVHDAQGKVIGAVVVFRDVTREQQIDKAKTEFVSLASHQLRTPLSAIGWYSELLLDGTVGKVTKKQRELIQQVFDSNKRMVDLVNSLLNVSRIDLGTLASDPKPLDMLALADSVLSELAPQIKERKIVLAKKYEGKSLDFLGDPNLLRIVVQNLLSNAVKYTPPKGKVSISIAAEKEYLHLIVADTGYGIPKAQQDKIFTKLFRADNAKEKEQDGNGLGLYIVRSIVETNGGKIWFESVEDKGTTFYVDLPVSGMKKIEGSKTLS